MLIPGGPPERHSAVYQELAINLLAISFGELFIWIVSDIFPQRGVHQLRFIHVLLSVLALATAAFAQNDTPFQVRYAANLQFGESYIAITNTGANGAPLLGPGFGGASGNICVNVYAFDPNEELVSCCSCLVTPDQTVNLGVNRDLTSKTLTGVIPSSVTVKLLATLAGAGGTGTGTVCNNSAANTPFISEGAVSINAALDPGGIIVPGLTAWGTTLHATPTGGAFATTETPFTPASLSLAEINSITGRCASIIGNASGFGQCSSCRAGALGGTKL